jgi:hypothetical protein
MVAAGVMLAACTISINGPEEPIVTVSLICLVGEDSVTVTVAAGQVTHSGNCVPADSLP